METTAMFRSFLHAQIRLCSRQSSAPGKALGKLTGLIPYVAVGVCLLAGCSQTGAPRSESVAATSTEPALLFIGQDLDAINGYFDSECCVTPDGLTAYISFYNLLDPDATYGGLGLDGNGEPHGRYADWGAGPKNAFETATGFGVRNLALGVSIAENEHPGALDALLKGEFDANIAQLARFIARVPGTVYLRLGYEFDGAWNKGYEDSARFVRVWRYVVDRLRSSRVENFATVWQAAASTADEIIDGRHEDISDWYPGDDYVDWLAFSWFMAPDASPGVPAAWDPRTPLQLAEEVLALARLANKPVMIAEAAPMAFDLRDRTLRNHSPIWDGPAGEDARTLTSAEIWRLWYGPLFALLETQREIRALAYINTRWDDQAMWGAPYAGGYWGDTRLEALPEIAVRFNAAVAEWRGAGTAK